MRRTMFIHPTLYTTWRSQVRTQELVHRHYTVIQPSKGVVSHSVRASEPKDRYYTHRCTPHACLLRKQKPITSTNSVNCVIFILASTEDVS